MLNGIMTRTQFESLNPDDDFTLIINVGVCNIPDAYAVISTNLGITQATVKRWIKGKSAPESTMVKTMVKDEIGKLLPNRKVLSTDKYMFKDSDIHIAMGKAAVEDYFEATVNRFHSLIEDIKEDEELYSELVDIVNEANQSHGDIKDYKVVCDESEPETEIHDDAMYVEIDLTEKNNEKR